MSCLPKPVLRGHGQRFGLRALAGAILFAGFNSSLYYFFVKAPFEKEYIRYMKKYDPIAHYNALEKWGYFQFGKDN